MLETKMFVYGTLMSGFRNYDKYLDGKVIAVRSAYIYGKLYNLKEKGCPGVTEGSDKVFGQVISFVDDENQSLLNTIDEFEKYFEDEKEIMFERNPVKVYFSEEETEELYYYKFLREDLFEKFNAEYIPDGNWRSFMNK